MQSIFYRIEQRRKITKRMGSMTHGLYKWAGYLAKGAAILVFFGITGWLALVFAAYAYLQLLWSQNPSPQQTNTTQTVISQPENDIVGKLPPNRVTPPIRVRRNRTNSRRVVHHDCD